MRSPWHHLLAWAAADLCVSWWVWVAVVLGVAEVVDAAGEPQGGEW